MFQLIIFRVFQFSKELRVSAHELLKILKKNFIFPASALTLTSKIPPQVIRPDKLPIKIARADFPLILHLFEEENF